MESIVEAYWFTTALAHMWGYRTQGDLAWEEAMNTDWSKEPSYTADELIAHLRDKR